MNSLRRTAEKYNMLSRGDWVLCALSAGADSTCMTHALASAAGSYGITLAAAHFSHGLRPGSAALEREMAEGLCRSLGIPIFFGEGDTLAFAREHGLSVEEAARRLRYAFLRRSLEQWRPHGKIATAHNLGDQAETVLFNLCRGSGIAGIKGISPVSGNIIRPLIETGREQIEQYLAMHALGFAQDPSNADTVHTRNRLRLQVLPLLSSINDSCLENIAKAGFFAGQAADFIDTHAEKLLSRAPGRACIAVHALEQAHAAVAGRAVALAYGHLSGGGGIYQRHIEGVLALARGKNPSAMVNLPQKIVARREYGEIIFEREGERRPPEAMTLEPGETIVWGDWRVSLSSHPLKGAKKIAKGAATFPLTVRHRLQGDVILTPSGTKSLKKLMIDLKIPKNVRDMTPVLCDNNGVLCVAGLVFRAGAMDGEDFLYINLEKAGDEI